MTELHLDLVASRQELIGRAENDGIVCCRLGQPRQVAIDLVGVLAADAHAHLGTGQVQATLESALALAHGQMVGEFQLALARRPGNAGHHAFVDNLEAPAVKFVVEGDALWQRSGRVLADISESSPFANSARVKSIDHIGRTASMVQLLGDTANVRTIILGTTKLRSPEPCETWIGFGSQSVSLVFG